MLHVPIRFCTTACMCFENLCKSYEEPHRSRVPLCALDLRLSPEVGQGPMTFNFDCMVRTFPFALQSCISYARLPDGMQRHMGTSN
jgi:hypothetical protein